MIKLIFGLFVVSTLFAGCKEEKEDNSLLILGLLLAAQNTSASTADATTFSITYTNSSSYTTTPALFSDSACSTSSMLSSSASSNLAPNKTAKVTVTEGSGTYYVGETTSAGNRYCKTSSDNFKNGSSYSITITNSSYTVK